MKKLPVITISRQYGSGGREIGQKLAEKLGIPYYDNELITLAAEESGFDRKLFEDADKSASSSLLFSLSVYGGQMGGSYHMPLADRVYLIQSDIVRKVASEGPCVIVGRCADYILREEKNLLSVFLRAPKEARVKHAVEAYGDDKETAADKLARTDKRRSVYYAHFTGGKWGDSSAYDMVINTDAAGIDGTVELLAVAAHMAAEKE